MHFNNLELFSLHADDTPMSRDRLSVPQTSSAVQITIVVSLNLVLALLTILSSSPCRVQIFLNGSRTRVYNYP